MKMCMLLLAHGVTQFISSGKVKSTAPPGDISQITDEARTTLRQHTCGYHSDSQQVF